MKVLYIDNRQYGHNIDLHIGFISYLSKKIPIIGYGKHLKNYLNTSYIPGKNSEKEFQKILKQHSPDIILTYNCNGSSYEVGLDNVALYSWAADFLEKSPIPKIHITTDYCRSGYNEAQAKWFKDLNYSLHLVRHKVSLKYPQFIKTDWLPFSVNELDYKNNIETKINSKRPLVGFIGAAHNSSHDLYESRIKAIDYLANKNLVRLSKLLNERKQQREILTGAKYIKFLTSNLFNLTCGGTCNYTVAKYFQIPAAYTLLIATQTEGIEDFPKDSYISYDKDNLDKLYKDINYHIKHKDITTDKIKSLYEHVINKHSHKARASQLIDIFNKIK